MTEENVDDEILEAELADDALEKRMKKLEAEAARVLHQSSELLQEMNKAREKQQQEEQQQDASLSGESEANQA